MRTTLTLDDDIAAKLRELRRDTGESLKAVVNRMLRAGLNARREQGQPKDPFHVPARDLGLRPGIRLDNVSELLEQLDGPGHP